MTMVLSSKVQETSLLHWHICLSNEQSPSGPQTRSTTKQKLVRNYVSCLNILNCGEKFNGILFFQAVKEQGRKKKKSSHNLRLKVLPEAEKIFEKNSLKNIWNSQASEEIKDA